MKLAGASGRSNDLPITGILVAVLAIFVGTQIACSRTAAQESGREFFTEEVLPLLAENGCPTCHSVGYVRPNNANYDELIRRLAIGDSATNNAVIYKIANLRSIAPDRPNHPGGQRCETLDDEPCKSIRRWWEIEFGNGGVEE